MLLLSHRSLVSEAVAEELRRAKDRKLAILPILSSDLGELPYSWAYRLQAIQCGRWDESAPAARVCDLVLQAIRGKQSLPEAPRPIPPSLSPTALDAEPAPSAEPRLIYEEGGAIPLKSPFYAARPADSALKRELEFGAGRTITVKGPRQGGKSSLLARARRIATTLRQRVVYIDFQTVSSPEIDSLRALYRYLCFLIADELYATLKLDDVWNDAFAVGRNVTRFLEKAILPNGPVVLLLDEVDKIFFREAYRDDFFAILRACHNQRALDERWQHFTLVLAHSFSPTLAIQNVDQSPFNVADAKLQLNDFEFEQVNFLNDAHGKPLPSGQLSRLRELVGGHPFLIRKALYTLKKEGIDLEELHRRVIQTGGPCEDHLHHLCAQLRPAHELQKALREIWATGACQDDRSFETLFQLGVVSGPSRHQAQPRCTLYRDYLKDHLL